MIYYVKLMPDKGRLFPRSNLRLEHRLATRKLKTAFSPSFISLASGQAVEPKCIFFITVSVRLTGFRNTDMNQQEKIINSRGVDRLWLLRTGGRTSIVLRTPKLVGSIPISNWETDNESNLSQLCRSWYLRSRDFFGMGSGSPHRQRAAGSEGTLHRRVCFLPRRRWQGKGRRSGSHGGTAGLHMVRIQFRRE